MKNILLVKSSPRGEASHSSHVADDLVAKLAGSHPGATVKVRDLVHDPLPYVGEGFVHALHTSPADRKPEDEAALAQSDRIIAEVQEADTIVIASGMINFGTPAPLKSWIDHLVRSGQTFRYSEEGIEGLVKGKKVYLVLAYGGVYSDGPMKALDFQGPYLRSVLGFIGLTDVEEIVVEGAAMGAEVVEKALHAAEERVSIFAAA